MTVLLVPFTEFGFGFFWVLGLGLNFNPTNQPNAMTTEGNACGRKGGQDAIQEGGLWTEQVPQGDR